ncbi:MAG: alcohol dehydrogenase [Marinilabiliales bacterium]|nr:MAG: alcohol dehydrogenase [Marinilabiliales bacterium]
MKEFTFQSTQKVVFGNKKINNLPQELSNLKAKRPFFVCDPVVSKLEFFKKLTNHLKSTNIEFGIFTDIESDPSFETADKASKAIIDFQSDSVIGIGGGSALDIAKIVAISAKTKETTEQLLQNSENLQSGLPLILIPTTAGTGSEVTHISILSNTKDKTKNGLVSPQLYANIAILDPEITLSLPQNVTAFSGIDAIIHALEALTSKLSTPLTDLLALEALGILHSNILTAFNKPNDIEARGNMLYGSMLAGKAFANSSVAAVHAFAYPIGAEFHIPHGLANSIMLLPVLRFNLEADLNKYAKAASVIGIETKGVPCKEAANQLIIKLDELLNALKIKRYLRFYNVNQSDIPNLAKKVMKITRLMNNNPRAINIEDAEKLYQEAF